MLRGRILTLVQKHSGFAVETVRKVKHFLASPKHLTRFVASGCVALRFPVLSQGDKPVGGGCGDPSLPLGVGWASVKLTSDQTPANDAHPRSSLGLPSVR